jgi:hypothetical protein
MPKLYSKINPRELLRFLAWDIYVAKKNYSKALNGDAVSTNNEISNCSPGGQTLTKLVELEEGTICTKSESDSHSVESGFEAIPGFKFFAKLSGTSGPRPARHQYKRARGAPSLSLSACIARTN